MPVVDQEQINMRIHWVTLNLDLLPACILLGRTAVRAVGCWDKMLKD
jgi:hypothetical protein